MSKNFTYEFNDSAGHQVATIEMTPPSASPHSDAKRAELIIHLSDRLPEPEATALEYHKLAGVLGHESKIVNDTSLEIGAGTSRPDGLAIVVSDHLVMYHNVPNETVGNFKARLQAFEAGEKHAPVVDAHLEQVKNIASLLQGVGLRHTPLEQHDPVSEKSGMGSPAPQKAPQLWNV